MPARKAIHLRGVRHGPGRPAGSRIGNTVYSATLSGRDPDTGELASEPAAQMEGLFQTMERFLEAAGASLDDVIHVNVTLAAPEHREVLNEAWLRRFNDETSLPVRKATVAPLPEGTIAQLELIAIVGE